ncbi:MAG: EamA family transporter, partial [Gemmatimonadales bacterium]|nr:EamA family transporter [Gemmatimonadales bacterium]
VWAEQFVASGPTSVYVATMPLWAALIAALLPGAEGRLGWRVAIGLLVGFAGSVLLAGASPRELVDADLRGPVALLLASSSWAAGSIYSKRHPVSVTPYIASAVQMVTGGAVLIVAGLALGEAPAFHLTWTGVGALAYLTVFGSIIGYTAYAYALKNAPPTIVNTYAYVNPVVAVLLGSVALHEPITTRTVAAMVLILGAVIWIQLAPGAEQRPASAEAGTSAERSREAAA